MTNSAKQERNYDIIDLLAWLRDNSRKDLTEMMHISKGVIKRITNSNPPKRLNGNITLDIPSGWANKFLRDEGEIEIACMVVVFKGANKAFFNSINMADSITNPTPDGGNL